MTPMHPNDPRHGTPRGRAAHRNAGEPSCEPCKEAHRRYMRRRDKLRRMGQPGRLPLGVHHDRLWAARRTGLTWQAIADQIGVSVSSVYDWANNSTSDTKVPGASIAKLAGWRPRSAVTQVGTLRRLQALTWLGYSAAVLAPLVGCNEQTIRDALRMNRGTTNRRGDTFHNTTKDAIARVYDDLWDKPRVGDMSLSKHYRAGATHARREAEAHGWLPPMAWDNIDDASENPTLRDLPRRRTDVDFAVVDALLAGRPVDSTKAEKDEAMRRWLALGRSEKSLCRIHGWHDSRYGKSDGEAA